MRPGPRLLPAVAVVTLLALLLPLAPALTGVLAAALLAVALAAGAEGLLLRGLVVEVEAAPKVALSLGQPDTVALALRTRAARTVHLTLRQVWPDLVADGSTTRRGSCRPGEVLRLELPVQPVARGRQSLAAPHVAATLWGLLERVAPAGAARELVVLPDLKAVARLHAKLNRFFLRGLGARASARVGKGRDFDRLREYVRGDDVRDIAWKASARRRKLIVREYRLDRSQDVLVCVDRGHRMAARVGALRKLDHAVNAAVLLAYLCSRMEDRVGMVSFGTEVDPGPPPARGSTQLRRLTGFAASVPGGYQHTDYRALAADLRLRLTRRTLLVILTALPEIEHEALLAAARLLVPLHLPLFVVFADPDLRAASRLLPADKAELSRTLAAQDLVTGREKTMRELRRRGCLVVESNPGDAGLAAVNAYIDVKSRQLL
jgi:uncharacterized protein (DUF58 family)